MVRGGFLFLFLLSAFNVVLCEDECVTYNFEKDFETMFSSDRSLCTPSRNWILNTYATANVDSPNPLSSKFVSPDESQSCIASFDFPMVAGGVLELNVYTEIAEGASSHIRLMIQQMTASGGIGPNAGTLLHAPNQPGYAPGWQKRRFQITVNQFRGYIVLMGMSSPGSVVLVDSFRYIPPGYNEEECIIYEDAPTTDPPTPPVTDGESDEVTDPLSPSSLVTNEDVDQATDTTVTESSVSSLVTDEDGNQGTDPTVTESSPSSMVTDGDGNQVTESSPPSLVTDNDGNEGGDYSSAIDSEEETSTLVPTPEQPNTNNGFWNPFTIAMVVTMAIILVLVLSAGSYELGKRNERKKMPKLEEFDYKQSDSSLTVPRVTQVYPDRTAFRNGIAPV